MLGRNRSPFYDDWLDDLISSRADKDFAATEVAEAASLFIRAFEARRDAITIDRARANLAQATKRYWKARDAYGEELSKYVE